MTLRRPALLLTSALAATALLASGTAIAGPTAAREVPTVSASYAGTGVGAIPDAPESGSDDCGVGTPGVLEVPITVTGMPAPLTKVAVSISMSHSYMGDVAITLVAPDGTSAPLVSRVGAAGKTATDTSNCGFKSNYSGTYVFADDATGNPWTSLGTSEPADGRALPGGRYRATGTGSATPIGLTAAFAGVTDPTGTWKLRVVDTDHEETGEVTAVSLNLSGKNLVPCQQATATTTSLQSTLTAQQAAADKATKKLKKLKKKDAAPGKVKKAKKKAKQAKKAVAGTRSALATSQEQQTSVC
jgi:subtilisin-like proprotein convertase family protein